MYEDRNVQTAPSRLSGPSAEPSIYGTAQAIHERIEMITAQLMLIAARLDGKDGAKNPECARPSMPLFTTLAVSHEILSRTQELVYMIERKIFG